jgi:hypothetical protein
MLVTTQIAQFRDHQPANRLLFPFFTQYSKPKRPKTLRNGPSLVQKYNNDAAVAMQCSNFVAFLFQNQFLNRFNVVTLIA